MKKPSLKRRFFHIYVLTKKFFSGFINSMQIDSVSFGAIPINTAVIKKYNKISEKFVNYPVHFVKLDANNKGDLEAVNKIVPKWKSAKYIQQIATSAHWMKEKPIEIYALTSQNENFERLQPNYILGFAEMREDKYDSENTLLRYLQVRPGAINVNQKHRINYKYVGSTILKSLKQIYDNISLFADNDKHIEAFYKKNGFISDFKGARHYAWSKNIIKRLRMHIEKIRMEISI